MRRARQAIRIAADRRCGHRRSTESFPHTHCPQYRFAAGGCPVQACIVMDVNRTPTSGPRLRTESADFTLKGSRALRVQTVNGGPEWL
jgi:hypothetical protein